MRPPSSPCPGAVADVILRVMASRMSLSLGQQLVVENRPGAGSSLGAEFVIDAQAHVVGFGRIAEIAGAPSAGEGVRRGGVDIALGDAAVNPLACAQLVLRRR